MKNGGGGGGRVASCTRINEFQSCINNCQLTDLGYVGPKFTWCNKRFDGTLVYQRLDQCLGNNAWIHAFPEAVVQHLPRIRSDHSPILFCSHYQPLSFSPRPFRCERFWLSQPDFLSVSKDVWANNHELPIFDTLHVLKDRLISWNKESFGNIFARKRRLLARMKGIDRVCTHDQYPFLLKLQNDLSIEYQKLLALEEELWASKARLDWLNLGDSNTSFFHSSVLQRRRSNKILCLKNNVGEWVQDPLGVKFVILDFFSSLFSSSQVCPLPSVVSPVNEIGLLNENLDCIPSHLEIKEALWQLKPFKATGPDGFQAGFFQNCWEFTKESIISSVSSVFLSEAIPAG